jgi:hypothetical protein
MNNQRRRLYRRGFTIGSGIVFFFGILAGVGYDLPFFNHYNPLYNPTILVSFAFGFYIMRQYIKDKKETTTMVAFFDKSGLAEAYDIEPSEEDATHIKYQDERGESISVKHSHPILLPTDDGYERIFLVPRKGRKALDPTHLVSKYGQSLTEKQVEVLKNIPEIEALNPDQLSSDMTEQDEPDTLFEEFTHHVAEIRRAVQDLLGAKPNLFNILMYAGVGGFATLILMILGHVDFSRVGG